MSIPTATVALPELSMVMAYQLPGLSNTCNTLVAGRWSLVAKRLYIISGRSWKPSYPIKPPNFENGSATMFGMQRRTAIAAVVSLLFALYMSVYFVLSYSGRYEPAAIGSNGVKCHSWAPRGFYADLSWRQKPLMFFAPLYRADRWLWHTDDKADSGRYPVTEVDPADIWKYYKAAGLLEESNANRHSAPALREPPESLKDDNRNQENASSTGATEGIIGTITLGGQPVGNVEFEFSPVKGGATVVGKTNAKGEFELKQVAPGEYEVAVPQDRSSPTGEETAKTKTDAANKSAGEAESER